MRITGLLILLLFILIFFAATAASYAQNSSTSTAKPAANAESSMAFDRALRDFTRGDTQLERNGVCFTMRTYVMAREDKNSDVTYPVRVTRCMPDSKLEFKSAVAPVRRSQDGSESTP